MTKKKLITLISLIAIAIVGSLFAVLACNMLMDDLFNKGVALSNMTILVSLPAVSVAVMFILATLYLIRTYRHPDCVKRITRLYLILAMVFSFIGVLGSILGGVLTYGTLASKHPFPGYLIIFMIINILILLCAGYGLFFFVKKMKDDEGRIKINFLYVLKTIGWVLFIGMAFSKFGLFLGMPVYVYTRNLYYTFPTYLYLLLPLFLGVIIVLYDLEILKRKATFILGIVSLGLNIAFFAYTVIKGLGDTSYISSISQIYPIDRMASLPIEVIIHFLAYLGVGAAIMVIARPRKEENK